jgi:hypothetical protein
LLCLGAACRGEAEDVDLAFQLQITPARPIVQQETSLELSVTDRAGQPVSGANLQIEAHMDHPGMAPMIAPAAERGGGLYAARMFFTMAGEWVVFASGTPLASPSKTMRVEVARLSVRAAAE